MQSSDVSNRCRSFTLVEIKTAINELSETLGEGAFGKVYRGNICDDGKNVDVAVKFMSTDPERGIPAFEIEKRLLSTCDHVNIISLVGYCDEETEKILVYEFMPNGSLYDCLYKHKDGTSRLTVEQRLEICIGVAEGLNYLHCRKDYNIIHSDLKTENILLDSNLVPKISDFGLSRTRAVGPSASAQVTKHIQGTEGYIAPECYEPNYKLSRKADVYAFGVVLLEVLCEKPGWERLVIWALLFISKGELPNFTPEHVVKNISPECLRACVNLIRDCLESDPNKRPSMSHVIANLDLVLTLQKMNVDGNGKKKSQANILPRFSFSDILIISDSAFLHRGGEVYNSKISIDVLLKHRSRKGDQFVYEGHHLLKEAKQILQDEINLFQNEIDLLSVCHHPNVVRLVGYCDEPDDKILMYEFMSNGSVYDYLYKPKDGTPRLTVKQRLEICLGVAKGLTYLHSINIIHCYLNSKNIFLDHNFVAKISNFQFSTRGVVRQVQRSDGMDGYLAPELDIDGYEESQKADVYAFGVVFLEVLSEKLAAKNLVGSALPSIITGELAKFTPEHVRAYISGKCAQACENLLSDCLDEDPVKRPIMIQVVDKLELALNLQIQEAYD